MALNWETRH